MQGLEEVIDQCNHWAIYVRISFRMMAWSSSGGFDLQDICGLYEPSSQMAIAINFKQTSHHQLLEIEYQIGKSVPSPCC